MKRWFLLSSVFVVVLAAVFAVTLPAAMVWRWIGDRAPQIKLHGINGTLWAGEAARFSARGMNLGKLTWTLSPWTLWRGEVDSRLALDGEGLHLTGKVHKRADGGLQISELTGDAQASWLAPALAIPVLEPSGRLTVSGAKLHLDPHGLPRDVDARVVWQEAGVRGQVMARFGTITIDARGQDGRITMTIEDGGDGELEVHGKVDLDQRNYRSEIILNARTAEGPVVEALKWIGAPRAEGGRFLLIEGHLLLSEPTP